MGRRRGLCAAPAPTRTSRPEIPVLLTVAATTLIGHGIGVALPAALWGANSYRFFPWPVLAVPAAVVIAVLLRVVPSLARDGPEPRPRARSTRLQEATGLAILTAAFVLLLWCFRARHLFLGDGLVLVTTLSHATSLHPLEPLAFLVERAVYGLVTSAGWAAHLTPTAPGMAPYMTPWLSAALVSIIGGAVFLPLAAGIAGTLAALREPPGPHVEHGPQADRVVRLLLLACIAGQGFIVLFFGYVEVYGVFTAGMALYLLLALRCLVRGAPLWHAAAGLALAIGLHLSALSLAPSFLVLAALRFRRPAGRLRPAADLTASAACFAALGAGLFVLGHGYNIVGTSGATVAGILAGAPGAAGYLTSAVHVRDFGNGALLAGPLGLALFVVAAVAVVRRHRAGWATAFMLACGAGPLIACWLAGDSNLGYARNWDLLAPAALPATVAGLGLLLTRVPDLRRTRLLLIGLVALSLFHTVPWVALNASLERSRARFALLPLGLGRVESTLGLWDGIRGDLEAAEAWFRKAIAANPGNVRAIVFLAESHMQEHRFDMAARAYEQALLYKPEHDDYAVRLAGALFMDGRFDQADEVVRKLIARNPADPTRHALQAIIFKAEGDRPGSERAMRQALYLQPRNVTLLAVAGSLNYRADRGALIEAWELAVGQVL